MIICYSKDVYRKSKKVCVAVMIKISPSILASDFSKLGAEAEKCEKAGADMLHIDVMDGHFVPNITIGIPVVKSLRKCVSIPFDVHLMISNPEKYIPDFISAGADIITFHAEADCDIKKCIKLIKSAGKKAGVSLKPATSASVLTDVLPELDMVLVMTVEPGFGGQSFMEAQLEKISEVKALCSKLSLSTDIQVDGGINTETAKKVIEAGANVLVAGSFVFNAQDTRAAIESLRQ